MGIDHGPTGFGERLKGWRQHAGVSQLQLAVEARVSPRHLSFIETGRARPSREMVLRLSAQLGVPLREQNVLLLAAGFAPAHGEAELVAPEMSAIRAAAQRVLANHEPFPAVALDRRRDIVMGNRAAELLGRGAAPALRRAPVNVYRLVLHPEGLASRIVDFGNYSRHLVARLARDAAVSGDAMLHALLAEVSAYPGVRATGDLTSSGANGALTLRLRDDDGAELAFLTTLATFGTPFDVTVSELVIESLFPADDRTEARLRALAVAA